jgi:hypothetical protein
VHVENIALTEAGACDEDKKKDVKPKKLENPVICAAVGPRNNDLHMLMS